MKVCCYVASPQIIELSFVFTNPPLHFKYHMPLFSILNFPLGFERSVGTASSLGLFVDVLFNGDFVKWKVLAESDSINKVYKLCRAVVIGYTFQKWRP